MIPLALLSIALVTIYCTRNMVHEIEHGGWKPVSERGKV